MNAEAMAPGCFGSPSMHAMDSEFCQKCIAYTECGKVAHATIAQLANVIDISDLIKRHEQTRKKYEKPSETVTELFAKPVDTLPKLPMQLSRKPETVKFDIDEKTMELVGAIKNGKAQAQALALAKDNLIEKSIDALSRGENPFESVPPKFLKVACDRLLHGGFTKMDLKATYMTTLSQTEKTAKSQVSIAVALLAGLRITQQDGRRFVLNPVITR